MTEFSLKMQRLQDLMDQRDLNAFLLQRISSFAWLTCGAASYVNTAATLGAASLLITPQGRYVVTTNIEATRLDQEEQLHYQGWEFVIAPWYETQIAIQSLSHGYKLGADSPYPGAVNLSEQIAHLRAALTPEEGLRCRVLGRMCAEAMESAIHCVQPGQTEHQIAARLAYETQSRGAHPIVNLVATDERIFKYRHPLPTQKILDRYAMLVLCGRRWGLVCSITRLVHFGAPGDEIRRKAEAVALVDATFHAATRPGASLGQIFRRAQDAYAAVGFANEWQLHHQGGPAGYEPREYLGLPGGDDLVASDMAFAWNPSITGVKSEDTLLVGESKNEVITRIDGWPMMEAQVEGRVYQRPGIMVIG